MVRFTTYLSVPLFIAGYVNSAAIDARHQSNNGIKGSYGKPKTGKAAYFLTNQAQNSVVALHIAADGTLTDGSITATGGNGGAEVNPATGAPTLPDGLASQGAIRVAGNVRSSTPLKLQAWHLSDHFLASVCCRCWLKYHLDVVNRFQRSNQTSQGWQIS